MNKLGRPKSLSKAKTFFANDLVKICKSLAHNQHPLSPTSGRSSPPQPWSTARRNRTCPPPALRTHQGLWLLLCPLLASAIFSFARLAPMWNLHISTNDFPICFSYKARLLRDFIGDYRLPACCKLIRKLHWIIRFATPSKSTLTDVLLLHYNRLYSVRDYLTGQNNNSTLCLIAICIVIWVCLLTNYLTNEHI